MSTAVASELFIDSTSLLSDPEALRARADEEGYLFFRGLIPAGDLVPVRTDLLSVVTKHGWTHPDSGPLEGRLDMDALDRVPDQQMRTDIGVSIDAYHDAQKLESVHKLPHHPALLALYRTFFGSDVLVHPRHIVRMVTPHHAIVPTPIHQDYPLIQGAVNTWTCWIPVGDCPRDMGGLTIMRKSHRLGCLPIAPAMGAGGISSILCPNENQWVEGDFEAGDVLTFPSYTVHKALPCRFPNRIRLSFDVRYQASGQEVHERSIKPHCDLTWEQIYADWKDDSLKYYWLKENPPMAEWNESLVQPGRRIC